MTPRGLLFDFDGVLIESEFAGNRQLAEWLTDAGYPTTPADSMANFMGLAGPDFRKAIEAWIGGPIPASFDAARDAEDARAMAEGSMRWPVPSPSFARCPPICRARSSRPARRAGSAATSTISGSPTRSATIIYSGREHVTRGKPAPDLYWHGALRRSACRSRRARSSRIPGRRHRRGRVRRATSSACAPARIAPSATTRG